MKMQSSDGPISRPGRRHFSIGEIDSQNRVVEPDGRTQQKQLTLAQSEDQFRQMPHFSVEETLPTRNHRPKIAASIKDPKEIPHHQGLRLIVRERGLGPDVVLISDFDYIRHGTRNPCDWCTRAHSSKPPILGPPKSCQTATLPKIHAYRQSICGKLGRDLQTGVPTPAFGVCAPDFLFVPSDHSLH